MPMNRKTGTRNIIVMMFLLLGCVACSGNSNADTSKSKKNDPLKYRKELAAINVPYTEAEFHEKILSNDTQAVELFLKAGMQPDKEYIIPMGLSTAFVVTPLIMAVKYDKFEIAKLLLKYGANPNKMVRQNHGRSRPENAFSVAMSLVKPKYVELLIKHGADITGVNTTTGVSPFLQSSMEDMLRHMGKPGYGSQQDAMKIAKLFKKYGKNKKAGK